MRPAQNIQFLILCGALCFPALTALAQPYNSQNNKYEVDQKSGCAPLTITITPHVACAPSPCTINYGDGSPLTQSSFTHTYTTPGTYTLGLREGGLNTQFDPITITVNQNIQPNFEIYGCSGSRAMIRVTDNNYAQYIFDFDNNGVAEDTLAFSNNILSGPFTYGGVPPITYTASVRGKNLGSADNCTAKTQLFTTMGSLPAPVINRLTSLDVNSVSLDLTTATNVLYRLQIATDNASSFAPLKTLYGVNTTTATGLNLDNHYYCFQLGAYDLCTPATTYTNIICSNKLVVTPQSQVINVTSNTSGSLNQYTIDRTPGPTVIQNTTSTIHNYPDPDVVCKTEYCYRVTTRYAGLGNPTSVSLEKCATAFSDVIPTAIDDVTATVDVPGAVFTWKQDPAFVPVEYYVTRRSGSAPYQFYTTTAASPYTDTGYSTAGKFCYLINYKDQCDNNSSPGTTTCPVQLLGSLSISNSISLNWSGYKGWKLGVKDYVLEKYNVNGGLFQTVILTPNDTVFLDDAPDEENQYVRYRVRVRANDPMLTSAYSNEVEFVRNANLYAPTAFTPNNDMLNDSFQVQGQYIQKMKLRVFDRWGAMIYSTEKNEPWDGNSGSKAMPPTTYVWKVDITDKAGRTFTEEGTVALIR